MENIPGGILSAFILARGEFTEKIQLDYTPTSSISVLDANAPRFAQHSYQAEITGVNSGVLQHDVYLKVPFPRRSKATEGLHLRSYADQVVRIRSKPPT
ncbi:hypothetical protein PM082_024545 [Marasmius tenuissimus]|nr:hypothetical protein PM082_024545 [Marasmius tenuissimus]